MAVAFDPADLVTMDTGDVVGIITAASLAVATDLEAVPADWWRTGRDEGNGAIFFKARGAAGKNAMPLLTKIHWAMTRRGIQAEFQSVKGKTPRVVLAVTKPQEAN